MFTPVKRIKSKYIQLLNEKQVENRKKQPYLKKVHLTKEEIMNWITKTCLLLMVVGGLNWGLVGVFNFDLVAFLFGQMSVLSRIVYTLVGIATVWAVIDYIYSPKIMVEE